MYVVIHILIAVGEGQIIVGLGTSNQSGRSGATPRRQEGRRNMKMTTDDRHKLRLVDVLRQQRDRLGSFDKLAQAIHTASGVSIDRRKLKNLVGDLDVSLRISELRALDTYLAPLGEGLAAKPVFERSAILAEIAQSLEVAFVLGSLPRRGFRRVDISHWDVRSMIEVLRSLNHYGRISQ